MAFFASTDTSFAYVAIEPDGTAVVQKFAADSAAPDISARIGPERFALSSRTVELLESAGLTEGLELQKLEISHESVDGSEDPWSGPDYYAVSLAALDLIDHDATAGRSSGDPPVYRRINQLVLRGEAPDDRAMFRLLGFGAIVFTEAFRSLAAEHELTGLGEFTPVEELDPFGDYV